MQNTYKIKTIIFDLGGVLLNIEPRLTGAALVSMGVKDMERVHARLLAAQLYQRFDSGSCSPASFRDEIRNACGIALSDQQVDEAWNALLLDFPKDRVKLLHSLSDRYRLFLLSNTNILHYPTYTSRFRQDHREEMTALFEKLFLSFEMGVHKPDPKIYRMAMEQGNMKPKETLFIDDVLENVEAAVKEGMASFHLKDGMEVTDLFDNNLLKNSLDIKFP